MADIVIQLFSKEYEGKWDNFVLNRAVNGTILQTRQFLNYHPVNRFVDNSLMIMKGTEIIGVIPANLVDTKRGKILFSHKGSTFGGIVFNKDYIKVSVLQSVLDGLDNYCVENNISEIHLKMTSRLYSKGNSELLDYLLFNHLYSNSMEVGYYINFDNYNEDIASNFSSSVRRHYRASLKSGLTFVEMNSREGIVLFYDVLLDNYKKFHTTPVHTLEDLCLLKEKVLKDNIRFFCVFKEGEAVAASMVFDFDHIVFHTQYLASKAAYSGLYVNEFLYSNLIACARDEKYPFLSFGTATLEAGKILNYNLAQYKEQYGTDQYVNRTYHKCFK